MIICTMCGNRNADDDAFCGDCGKFLEWNGEKVVVPETVVVVEEPPPAPAEQRPRGWWRRLTAWVRRKMPTYTIEAREPRVPVGVAAAPVMAAASAPAMSAGSPPVAAAQPVPAGGPPKPSGPAVPGGPPTPSGPPPVAAGPPKPGGPPPVASGPPKPGGPPVPSGPPTPSGPPMPSGPPTPSGPPIPGGPPKPGGPPIPGAASAEPPADDEAERAAKAELVAALVNPISGEARVAIDATPEVRPQPIVKKVRPIVKTKSSRRFEPGDLVCAICGEGNPPHRHFCSRCGESLADAGVVTAVWWRRFFRWVLSLFRRRPLAAGTRPGQKGTSEHRRSVTMSVLRRMRLVVGVLFLVLALAYAFYPPFRTTVRDNAVAIFHQVEPSLRAVHPDRVSTNVQARQHPALAAADEYTDTYWLASWTEQQRPKITFYFQGTGLLRGLILRSGASDDFVGHGRPSILLLTYSNGRTETLTPQDTSAAQVLTLSNTTLVDSVSVEVLDTYAGEGAGVNDVAITEMEWFDLK